MITTPRPRRQAPSHSLYLALALLAVVAAVPQQDANTNVGSPFLLSGQAWTSSEEETADDVQDVHQVIPSAPSLPDDDDIHPFLDVDDLSAEYEYEFANNESEEDDDDAERVRRSLMGRGSTARGGRRGGAGDISRRRDNPRYDYGAGSSYTWSSKRAPIPAPAIIETSNSSPSTATNTTTNNTKSKKERKKKKKSGAKNKERNGLTKELRQEIALFALQHGLGAANEAYKSKVGRLLPEKVIDKWVQRLRKKQNKYGS